MNTEHLDKMKTDGAIWEFHKEKGVDFIWGDNIEFLRWCKEEMLRGYFHVGIVDPPYAINVGTLNMGTRAADRTDEWKAQNRSDWDEELPTSEYWTLLKYVCRKLIVFGGNYFCNELPPGRCWIVWDKLNGKMTFAAGELILTTFDRNAVIISRPRNAKGSEETEKRHITQKPVYLYDYLHLNFVEKRQRVLDTHGGSFNHSIAAMKNGTELTIMDKSELYYRQGLEACKKEMSISRLMF